MSGFTTKDAHQMLDQTHETQDKTKEAIDRMRQKTAESEQVGSATLEELRRQGEQMDDVIYALIAWKLRFIFENEILKKSLKYLFFLRTD